MNTPNEELLLGAEEIARKIRRMASAIVEQTRGSEALALIGIRRGGVGLAQRIASAIEELEGRAVPVGTVDIALYRDDAATALPDPKIGPSEVPFDIADRDLVLIDDVLQTGRTVRAAIECLLDYGRPRRVWLAALLDRGGRELPIAADFVGQTIDVPVGARLDVVVREDGQADRVTVITREGGS